MLYYLLPKIDNKIIVSPSDNLKECELYISHSLYEYSKTMQTKLKIIQNHNTDHTIEKHLLKKTPPYSELFYELVEFFIVSNNNHECCIIRPTKILFITPNYNDAHDSVEFVKNKNNCTHTNSYTHFNNAVDYFKSNNIDKFDFMFFELPIYDLKDVNQYIIHALEIVMIIIKTQRNKGCCLIKLNYIYHKPIIDILFLLSSVYSNIYLIKPTLINMTDYKYVFCKHFSNNTETTNQNYKLLDTFLHKPDLQNITQLIDYDTPAYFIYKINEINLIIGQQQLELSRQLLHIHMAENQLFKLDQYKQKNIQKCMDWCCKMNIPYNTIENDCTYCSME